MGKHSKKRLQEIKIKRQKSRNIKRTKEKLHKELERFKKYNKEKHNDYISYKEAVENIQEHNFLQKQAYLINHKNLHRLMIGVLGRLIGYSHHYERDWYFITLAKIYEMGKKPETVLEKRIDKLKNGQINAVFKEDDIKNNDLEPKNTEYKKLKSDVDDIISFPKNAGIRNDLAHFNMLNNNKLNNNKLNNNKLNNNKKNVFPLTHWINQVRTLVCYDRKLKNAVIDSIITIFEKENMEISFTMDNSHTLSLDKIETKYAKHLGNIPIPQEKDSNKKEAITEPLQSETYLNMVRAMFA